MTISTLKYALGLRVLFSAWKLINISFINRKTWRHDVMHDVKSFTINKKFFVKFFTVRNGRRFPYL